MRSTIPWILAAILLMAPGFAAPARAQGWDDEDAAREKRRQAEQQARDHEREMREREEMERRKQEGMEGGPDGPPRPGPGGPGGQPMRRPSRALNEQEQKEILAWLKDWDPDRLEKIEHTRSENPDFYMNLLSDNYMEMKKVQEMKSRDPDQFDAMMKERKLDVQTRQLSEKYRKTEDAEQKASIKTELQTVLGQLFDLREANREREVKELEKRLSELRQMVEKRRTNKVMIVENRLKQLLGEKEFMDW